MMIRLPLRHSRAFALVGERLALARTNRTFLVLAALLIVGAVQAQAPAPASARPIARLTGLQGNVLVSQPDGMAAAVNGQPLAPGVRVITTAGSKVTISYDRGCLIDLGENRRYMVRESAECAAAKAPELGAATPFAVLAGPQVINTGGSVIRGDLGVSPGTAVAGFPQGEIIEGTIQASGERPTLAQKDAATAYAELASEQCNVRLAGQDLGGQTLAPGVYCFPATSARLTGELVLDAQGDPEAVFVFQVGTTLTTAAKSSVRVINSGQQTDSGSQGAGKPLARRINLCHVYWQVGDSVALGRDSTFVGSIIATKGIGVGANADVYGRALAKTGVVTMDSANIEIPGCAVVVAAATSGTGTLLGVGIPLAIGAGAAVVNAIRNSKSPN